MDVFVDYARPILEAATLAAAWFFGNAFLRKDRINAAITTAIYRWSLKSDVDPDKVESLLQAVGNEIENESKALKNDLVAVLKRAAERVGVRGDTALQKRGSWEKMVDSRVLRPTVDQSF